MEDINKLEEFARHSSEYKTVFTCCECFGFFNCPCNDCKGLKVLFEKDIVETYNVATCPHCNKEYTEEEFTELQNAFHKSLHELFNQ